MSLVTSMAVVAHGGAASSVGWSDGCRDATRMATLTLERGGTALDAAIEAVVRLEDDGRFNAGVGSIFGLDGETIEMDAALMDSEGTLGSVACVTNVRNPIRLAAALTRTPHCMLVGVGADRFARTLEMPTFAGPHFHAQAHHRKVVDELLHQAPASGPHSAAGFRGLWNYPSSWEDAMKRHGHGTVGAVVRDGEGRFAVATSTGGCAPSLLGRVGDTPLIGCGFFAGPHGAVAVTGVGEYIIRNMVAHRVYHWICSGMRLHDALDKAVALLPSDVSIGVIGVTRHEAASRCNQDMAVDVST